VTRVLIVTAVKAEAEAVEAGADPAQITVKPVGVGPAAAAAGTARLLTLAEAAGDPYRAVICAGIAGGFPGRAPIGATVLATRSIAADLGAETPEGFLPIDELGFGQSAIDSDKDLFAALKAALPEAITGEILTLATVTGTKETAIRLAERFPNAVAEAMEGHGAASAAQQATIPFMELRTISNAIGPRDRAAWRLSEALASLRKAAAALRFPG
jgi:futalosine hydrolase